MRKYIFIIFYLISLYICQEEKKENVEKALLINTDLTKEELESLLKSKSNHKDIYIEEVESEKKTGTEKIMKSLKNGKLKIKIKMVLDLNDIEKNETEIGQKIEELNNEATESSVKTAFIKTYIEDVPKKVSLFKYVQALFIMLLLMYLFILSSQNKQKKRKLFIEKNDDYILEDNLNID